MIDEDDGCAFASVMIILIILVLLAGLLGLAVKFAWRAWS